jgi:integrase/recombinase XerC
LLDSIDTAKVAGLRDRALIGLMVYSFARIGAAVGMTVEDVYTQNRRLWVRLREKGGKRHAMPCHHNLEEYLTAYLDGAGLRDDPKGPLFRTIGRGTGKLTLTVLPQANAYAMIGRRAAAAGIATRLGNHSFRATGITAISRTAGRSKRPQLWQTMLRRARRSFTIVGARSSASMRSSGLRFDARRDVSATCMGP